MDEVNEKKPDSPAPDDTAAKPEKPATDAETTAEANPWLTGNLTQQGRLLRDAPELAARLQAAARGQRGNNPFSREGQNLTAQAQLLRDNPKLAQMLKAEAAGPVPNPWRRGPEFNLTAQCLMMRDNPAKAARLKADAEAFNKEYREPTPRPRIFRRRMVKREGGDA